MRISLFLVFILHLFCAKNNLVAAVKNSNFLFLTYDDGPSTVTFEICDLLKKYNVKATFFVLGENVKKYHGELKRIYQDGHLIGNHTYSHMNFYKIDKSSDIENIIIQEIEKTENEILNVIGIVPKVLRYPYGYSRKHGLDVAIKKGYKVFNWTFGYDWNKINDDELIKKYLEHIKPNAIILMHDTPKRNKRVLKITEEIIKEAKKKKFKFATLDEIISR
ncbi:MAG: polysaccharide deacetylase family protein [Elusimicrobiota bacterium]